MSTALATVRLNLPIIVAGSLFLRLSSILALIMPEQHFRPARREERTSWQQMGYTLRTSLRVVRQRPVLLTIVAIGAFYSIFGAGFDRLWPYHLQHDLTFPAVEGWPTVIWFGLIEAGITLTNSARH